MIVIIILLILFIQVILVNVYGILYYQVNADSKLEESNNPGDSIDLIEMKQQSFSASAIPVSYDMRSSNPFKLAEHGNLTINSEPQVGGTCWDYATLMALQTFLAKKEGKSNYTLLSKAHLDYVASKYSGKNYAKTREIGKGGNFTYEALKYFKNGDGPVFNSKCFFTLYNGERTNERVTLSGKNYYNNTTAKKQEVAKLMDKLEPDVYVHEIIEFPKIYVKAVTKNGVRSKETTYAATGEKVTASELKQIRDSVKKYVMNSGAAYCSIRTNDKFIGDNLGDTNYNTRYSQYDDGTVSWQDTGGHAIAIIGWDDNYSKNNFKVKNKNGQWVKPIDNGAWLIMNHRGNNELQGGCQWISYEDYTINEEICGYVSADRNKKICTYKFSGEKVYNKLKGLCSEYVGGVTCTDKTKTISALDLIFNDFRALNINKCEMSDADFKVLLNYKLPKLTYFSAFDNNISNISDLSKNKDILKEVDLSFNKIKDVSVFKNMSKIEKLNLQHNQISDVTPLKLTQYSEINLKNQTISVELGRTSKEYKYPSIFTEAKKSSSKLYSKDGFTFSGCKEKSDGTGITLTSNNAKITIKSGNAAGTILNITKPADNAPTIKILKNSDTLEDGETVSINTKLRIIFSDDDGIVGYNITSSTAQPTSWVKEFDEAAVKNVRIINKTFASAGNKYIWVKDTGGNISKSLVIIKDNPPTISMEYIGQTGTIKNRDSIKKGSKIRFTFKDDDGISGYQVTNSTTTSTKWETKYTETTSNLLKKVDKTLSTIGTNYIYVKDTAGNVSKVALIVEGDPPTISMSNATNNGTVKNGASIEKNTKIKFVFKADNGVAGYNVTQSSTAPKKWQIKYDEEASKNSKTVVKTLSTVGTNYIWVIDNKGKTVKVTLTVKPGLPVITMAYNGQAGAPKDGGTVEKGSSIKFILNADEGVAGYNVTQSATTPTKWLTKYSQETSANVKIVNTTLSTIGKNYIWLKDKKGNTVKVTLTVKAGPPTISLAYKNKSVTLKDGDTVEKGTIIKATLNADNGVAGYQVTNNKTTPTKWLTKYSKETSVNEKIADITLSTVGTNYIWLKDKKGNLTKITLNVKETILIGDVDRNGTINVRDLVKIRKYIANQTKWQLTSDEKTKADVDKDGKITIRDIINIRKYIAADSNDNVAKKHPNWKWK